MYVSVLNKMYLNVILGIFVCCFLSESIQYEFVVFTNRVGIPPPRITKRDTKPDVPKIEEFHVETHVGNRFAETNVISKVVNSDDHAKQTAFSVALPERAFISGFVMEIDGKSYTAYIKEKEEARRLFGQAISTGQTAAHVSITTKYSNRFTVNMNVEPFDKVLFNLTYEELLERENGEYQIITNIQPGQIVKKLKIEVTIRESEPLSWVNTTKLRSGSGGVVQGDADPHAVILRTNNSALVIFEPDVKRQLEFVCAGLGNTEYDGVVGQFIVKYDVDRTNQGGETLVKDGFMVTYFAPTKGLPPLPKHFVFILDTSGSMDGFKISQLKDAMVKILPQLNTEDVFSVVQYASTVHVWSLNSAVNVFPGMNVEILNYGNLEPLLENTNFPQVINASEENINKVISMIRQLVADDATNAMGALEVGLFITKKVQLQYPQKYKPIILFLTDGLPNVGTFSTNQIVEKITDINKAGDKVSIYSLGFGLDVDFPFLHLLSIKNEAEAKLIKDDGESVKYLEDFYKKVSVPLLGNVNVNYKEKAEITDTNFKLYFNGSEIIIAAKGVSNNSSPVTVSAEGKHGPVNFESKLGIPRTKLEKIWAHLTVKQLEDHYLATGNETFAKIALNIALNYSLVSNFTSLVVVKPDSTGNIADIEDGLVGIFPKSPEELTMCQNITDWIMDTYGSTEAPISTTTVNVSYLDNDILESRVGYHVNETTTTEIITTEIPTTTPTTTTEKITCHKSVYGCCYDGVTISPGPNGDGCDPIPKSESCSLYQERGPCNNMTFKWFYSTKQHRCLVFQYSGCGGNGNRFSSKQDCEKTCVYPPDFEKCKLPISLGRCNKRKLYWFYDKNTQDCVKFMYGGCYGNSNRFSSKEKCLELCNPKKLQKTLEEVCFQPKDMGYQRCKNYEKNFYFNSTNGQCMKFWFTGCGGNDNRFLTKDVCEKMCINSKNKAICKAPPEKGNCSGGYHLYYYNDRTKNCSRFVYSGCGGNKNKFRTLQECEKLCKVP